MKIEWEANDGTGRSSIIAIPEGHDATPYLSKLSVDGMPINIHGDRFAVAAYLAFGRYCGGNLEMPFPVSPVVAQAIQDCLMPSWTQVGPVDFEPKALPIGLGTLHLVFGESANLSVANEWGEPRSMLFELKRSDRFSGTLSSLDHYVTSSNAWIFAGNNATPFQALRPYLAWSVLFAESWQVDTIQLPGSSGVSTIELDGLSHLLESCRLGVRLGNERTKATDRLSRR